MKKRCILWIIALIICIIFLPVSTAFFKKQTEIQDLNIQVGELSYGLSGYSNFDEIILPAKERYSF